MAITIPRLLCVECSKEIPFAAPIILLNRQPLHTSFCFEDRINRELRAPLAQITHTVELQRVPALLALNLGLIHAEALRRNARRPVPKAKKVTKAKTNRRGTK